MPSGKGRVGSWQPASLLSYAAPRLQSAVRGGFGETALPCPAKN